MVYNDPTLNKQLDNMAILRGIQTSVVDIEVSNRDLHHAVIKAVLEKNPDLRDIEFIEKGQRMIFDYIHPHNGDEYYKSGGPATEKDYRFIEEIKKNLWELLK